MKEIPTITVYVNIDLYRKIDKAGKNQSKIVQQILEKHFKEESENEHK